MTSAERLPDMKASHHSQPWRSNEGTSERAIEMLQTLGTARGLALSWDP